MLVPDPDQSQSTDENVSVAMPEVWEVAVLVVAEQSRLMTVSCNRDQVC